MASANMNASSPMLQPDQSDQRGLRMVDSNVHAVQPIYSPPCRNCLDGPVAILWDIENCPVPSAVCPEDVAGNIRMALRVHPVIKGAVVAFSAYGDFNAFPRRLREGCQRTGVKLIDVPNGRKDAADKAILVDMFLFALDNPPPSSIMLISGDVDFAPALHILGQRGYTVILVIPSGVGVSSALCNAGKFVWDWPSVARGEGFIPSIKTFMPPHGGAPDIAGYLMGRHINENLDGPNEEEAIVYRGYYNATRDFSVLSQSVSEYNCSCLMTTLPCFPTNTQSQRLPSFSNEVSAGPGPYDQSYSAMWVQPGDINGLKAQLVKLLELSGGCLPFTRVPSEYQKLYGRPLYVSEYGALKLVNLFKKMSDALAMDGKGQKKLVYLRNWKAGPSAPPVILARNDKKVKGTAEESLDVMPGGGSSDELSEEERVVVEENEEKYPEKTNMEISAQCEVERLLEQFKYELQEILVSYSCGIFLGHFAAIYQQRYKKPLDYQRFNVDRLDDLLEKVRDVVVLMKNPKARESFWLLLVASIAREVSSFYIFPP